MPTSIWEGLTVPFSISKSEGLQAISETLLFASRGAILDLAGLIFFEEDDTLVVSSSSTLTVLVESCTNWVSASGFFKSTELLMCFLWRFIGENKGASYSIYIWVCFNIFLGFFAGSYLSNPSGSLCSRFSGSFRGISYSAVTDWLTF